MKEIPQQEIEIFQKAIEKLDRDLVKSKEKEHLIRIVTSGGYDRIQYLIGSGTLFIPSNVSIYPLAVKKQSEWNKNESYESYPLGYIGHVTASGIIGDTGFARIDFKEQSSTRNLKETSIDDLTEKGLLSIEDEYSKKHIFTITKDMWKNDEGKSNTSSLYLAFRSPFADRTENPRAIGRISIHRDIDKTFKLYEELTRMGRKYL